MNEIQNNQMLVYRGNRDRSPQDHDRQTHLNVLTSRLAPVNLPVHRGTAAAEANDRRMGRDNRTGNVVDIHWQFWRMAGRQSQYRYRGAPNVIDLGEL